MAELLTRTSEIAIKALIQLKLREDEGPITPGVLAEALDCSSSYLAKILGTLTRAGILTAQRGAQGGVQLAMPVEQITLLTIMETVQGVVLPSYCQTCELGKAQEVCAYHQAMIELYSAATVVLKKWTVADLVKRPLPAGSLAHWPKCRMRVVE